MADDVLSRDLGFDPSFRFWNRGYLPHIEAPEHVQMVTFRLADALPKRVVEEIQHRRAQGTCREVEAAWAEPWLDAGHGSCLLREPENADIVARALHHGDGAQYDLLAWVIMPNHVHVVFRPNEAEMMSDILHSWKSFTAHQIQRRTGASGRLWQRGYFDRLIRDDRHLLRALDYVEQNPVAAELVEAASDWLWSSAGGHVQPGLMAVH
jgi:REP element-mobilizing transposase RayT